MPGFPFRSRLRTLACACLLATAPLARADAIKPLMRDMNRAMQGAMKSATMPQLRSYVTRLEDDAQKARRQHYGSNQATYDAGMQALRKGLDEVDGAIRANDMAAAKRGLQRIIVTRNHYHKLLR